jgi:hypothetical protein
MLTDKKPESYLRVQNPDAAKDHDLQGDLVLVTWQYNLLESHFFRSHSFFSYTIILFKSLLVTCVYAKYRGADKSLARPGRKQATATGDF